MKLRIGIVAGEPSGDQLGGALMESLARRVPGVEFSGIGGERMLAAELRSLAALDRFAVNGFVEPLRRLPALVALYRDLRDYWLEQRPDVFIGVDFNVFNLILERSLREGGIRTVHYVSPSVYAWRRGRVARIGRSADLVLTLFPFEPPFYIERGIRAEYVGHPLADAIDLESETAAVGAPRGETAPARAALNVPSGVTVVALLPGSRASEIQQHGELFLRAARLFAAERPTCFLVPCVNEGRAGEMREIASRHAGLDVRIVGPDSRRVLAACDVALIKSGTGTLEAMLLGKPMVVAYRLPELSYQFVKLLFRSRYVALPNILADRALVPEILQHDATPRALATALTREFERGRTDVSQRVAFRALHTELRRGASERAADAVLRLVRAQ